MSGKLTLIGTPIGNLQDLSPRAIDGLKSADLILCEDTRVTAKLCTHFGISTHRKPYHEHNAEAVRPRVLEALSQGQNLALVSDAGMPLISDPGYRLVDAVLDAGFNLDVIPGPTAVATALVLSGLPSDRFLFAGFLPNKSTARRASLDELAAVPASLAFYEGPSRLAAMLADAAEILGPRQAAVCREMTKFYQETRRDGLAELAQHYAKAGAPKGEIVVVVGPPAPKESPKIEDLDALLIELLQEGSLRDAVGAVAEVSGLKKKLVYDRALALKGQLSQINE